MSVATKRKRTASEITVRPEDLNLQFLVSFLNSDLANLNRQDDTQVLIKWFFKRYNLNSPKGMRKAKELQHWIRNDILDVIVPERRGMGKDLRYPPDFPSTVSPVLKSLMKLFAIIERMDLTTKVRFDLITGRYKLGVLNGKTMFNRFNSDLGRNRHPIEIGGEKWIVRESSSFSESPGKQLYMIIAESLKNGEFSDLRLCRLRECGNILIQKNSRREFCYDTDCKNRFENRKRQKEGYYAKWQRRNRAKQPKEESKVRPQYTRERAYERFFQFMKSPDQPTIKRLGKGDPSQGKIIYEDWKRLNKKLYPLDIWDKKLTLAQRGIFGSNT